MSDASCLLWIARLVPPVFLVRTAAMAARMVERRHPALFACLSSMSAGHILLDPDDLPYRFVLRTGKHPDFYVCEKEEEAQARVAGPLDRLIAMLEGRADGDALFFSREIRIEGDTEMIVALRNALEREEISLEEELLALCGPFKECVSFLVSKGKRGT